MAKDRKPEDWGPKERFQAVLDAQDLDEQKLSQFLRTKGLHSSQITEWRKEALTIVGNSSTLHDLSRSRSRLHIPARTSSCANSGP